MVDTKIVKTMIYTAFLGILLYLPNIDGKHHGSSIGPSEIRSYGMTKARHQAILDDLNDMLNPVFRDLRKLSSVGPRKTCVNPITGDIIVFDECVDLQSTGRSKGTKGPGQSMTKSPSTGSQGSMTKSPGKGKGTKSPGNGTRQPSTNSKQTCAPTPEPSVSLSPSESPTTTSNPTKSQTPTESLSPTLSLEPSLSPSESPTTTSNPTKSQTPTESLSPTLSPTSSVAPSTKSAKQSSSKKSNTKAPSTTHKSTKAPSTTQKSTKAPSTTQKSAPRESQPDLSTDSSSNSGPPVCTAEDLNDPAVDALLDFCTQLATGTAEPTTLREQFQITLTLFSADTADTDLFQQFLQFIVAPLAAGCAVDITNALSLLTASRRLLDADDSNIKSVDVDEFLVDAWGAGASMCSETPPNDSDYCTDGRVLVTTTGTSGDALEEYQNEFVKDLESLLQNEEVLGALGLTGVTTTDVTVTESSDDSGSGGGTVSAVEDSDQPVGRRLRIGYIILGVLVGLALCILLIVCGSRIIRRNRSLGRYNQPLKVDYDDEDDDFTKLIDDRSTNRSESMVSFEGSPSAMSQRDKYSPRQPPSSDAMDTRKPPVPREVRHQEDDLFSVMTPATARSSPRMAHILGEDNSIFTGNSWQGSRDRQLPPVYQAPVDADGFPASIHTTSDTGNEGIFDSTYQHPPHMTCSSPGCQICEKKRQQSNIRFIKVADPTPLSPRPSRFGPKRNYVIEDTCDL